MVFICLMKLFIIIVIVIVVVESVLLFSSLSVKVISSVDSN